MSALHLKGRWGQGLEGELLGAGEDTVLDEREYCLTLEPHEWVQFHSATSQSNAGGGVGWGGI